MEEYEKGKISITKNTKGITIPSEEERVAMYPLDYEEFRGRWEIRHQFLCSSNSLING